MNWTKQEIENSKRIAELGERKEIKYGDYFLNEGGFAKVWPYRHNCKRTDVILLWSWQDCFDWLMNKGYVRIDIVLIERRFVLWCVHGEDEEKNYEPDGDTIKEAIQKCVIKVLEEKSE